MSAAASAQLLDATPAVLKALYVVNKRAKQFAREAEDSYFSLGPVTADCPEALTERKTALYEVKRTVLQEIHTEASRIELHDIRGSEFYCFYFGSSWSFHTPVSEFEVEVEVDGHIQLPDFDTSHAMTRAQLSLDEALQWIDEDLGINANDCFEQRHLVTADGSFLDIGWSSLDTA